MQPGYINALLFQIINTISIIFAVTYMKYEKFQNYARKEQDKKKSRKKMFTQVRNGLGVNNWSEVKSRSQLMTHDTQLNVILKYKRSCSFPIDKTYAYTANKIK